MSATRFAPHLAKCLKLGARGQAAKKGLNSDLNKLGGLLSSDQQKNLKKIGNSQEPKKRGRPKKNAAGPSDSEALPPGSTSERPKKNIVTTPERDAMLSNAITNATQRLTMQKLTGTQASTNPITSFNRPSVPPHPLSQSHIIPSTSMADSGVPPPPKVMLKRKKKERSQSQRSRHSSQASSSSDSDYDMVTQDMDQEVDHGNANNLPSRSGGVQQGIENGIQPADTAPKKLDQVAPMSNVPQDSRITNPVPPPPAPVATSVGIPAPSPQIIPMRPPLKRKSSSQADSTDGTDSE
ncbi:hypothetical protein DFH28DRAFT_274278 [Melampsora americana]|nr:hypothetical protein DFH28DRAFT_274278 [Melampsora americana]